MKILHVNCADNGSTGAIIDSIAQFTEHQHILCAPYITREHNHLKAYGVCYPHELGICRRISAILGYRYGFAPLSTHKIIGIIRKEKPDIIHLHSANCHVVDIYRLLAYIKKRDIPLVVTNHAEFFYTGSCSHAYECDKWKTGCGSCCRAREATQSLRKDITARAFQKMKRAFEGIRRGYIISVSPWQISRSLASPILEGIPQACIKNGVDTSVFRYMESAASCSERIVLYVTPRFSSSDTSEKGGAYLLRLAESLKHEVVRFIIIGRMADESVSALPDNVRWGGFINNPEVLAQYYCMADLVVTLSRRETYGMTVAEALLCGTPVVGFQNGGSDSIALPQYTEFVAFGDVQTLSDRMREKWLYYKDGRAQQIAASARTEYGAQTMAEQYDRIYRKVCQ